LPITEQIHNEELSFPIYPTLAEYQLQYREPLKTPELLMKDMKNPFRNHHKIRQKILFISHEATRTGAPLVLLNLLKNMKEENNYLFDVLLIYGGSLQDDFINLSDKVFTLQKKGFVLFFTKLLTHILKSHAAPALLLNFVENVLNSFQAHQYSILARKLKRNRYLLIYSNTVCSAKLTSELKKYLSIPVILHVHELEYSIDLFVGHECFLNYISSVDRFIAVSESVKENLIEKYGVCETKILIVYPSSPNLISPCKKKEDILKELNINEKSFVIGSSGTGVWIKGYDVFINLAYCFFKKYPKSICIFMWVGKISESDYINIKYDLDKIGLSEKVKFIGEKTNPIDYYNAFDVFALTSRVDSFSLVCMESAFLSKPLICFDNTGHVPRLIGKDAGFVIPYMDIEYMASKIYLLYQDQNLKNSLGDAIRKKYLKIFDSESSFRQVVNYIDNLVNIENGTRY
jgi:glycosyltransferase involved in cell wall biosynthesis